MKYFIELTQSKWLKLIAIACMSWTSNLTISTPAFAHPPCVVCKKDAPMKCPICNAPFCGKECQAKAWPEHKKEHPLIGGVQIRPSNIPGAGQGLFALKDFKKGELVAFYHGDNLRRSFKNQVLFGAHSHAQKISEDSTLIGKVDIDPETQSHLGGQIANDPLIDAEQIALLQGVDCNNTSKEYMELFETFAKKYSEKMRLELKHPKQTNVVERVDLDRHPLVTTRAVKQDEEIFYAYGLNFWMSIPIHICNAHGLPGTAFRLQRAASRGAASPEFYDSFITKETANTNIKTFSDIQWQISNLFADVWTLQIQVLDEARFLQMIEKFKVRDRLAEIAALPNSEFSTANHFKIVHPRSRELFGELNFYRMQQMLIRTDDPIFYWVNAIDQRVLSAEEEKLFMPGP